MRVPQASEAFGTNERVGEIDDDQRGDRATQQIFDQHGLPSQQFACPHIGEQQREGDDGDGENDDIH